MPTYPKIQEDMKLVTGAVCLWVVLAQGLNIDDLERLVSVTLTFGQTVSRLNIMCKVTPVELKSLMGHHNLILDSPKKPQNEEMVWFGVDKRGS